MQQTTLTTLAALVPRELNAEIELVDEAVDPVPDDFRGADLVGISAMTCDAQRAYQLAGMARARNIAVVLGGYHPTFMPEEAGEHADCSRQRIRRDRLASITTGFCVRFNAENLRVALGRTPSYPACRFPSATC